MPPNALQAIWLYLDPKNTMSQAEEQPPSSTNAATRVFGIPELLENVLQHVDPLNLLRCQQVCRTSRTIITSSPCLQRRLFLHIEPVTHLWDAQLRPRPPNLLLAQLAGQAPPISSVPDHRHHNNVPRGMDVHSTTQPLGTTPSPFVRNRRCLVITQYLSLIHI